MADRRHAVLLRETLEEMVLGDGIHLDQAGAQAAADHLWVVKARVSCWTVIQPRATRSCPSLPMKPAIL